MSERDEPKPRKRRGFLYFAVIGLGMYAVIGFLAKLWYNYKFPYGHSHSCSKGLGLDLKLYARDNDDWFPHGGVTPEASLGFLHSNNPTPLER
jgi:hypothetical protein